MMLHPKSIPHASECLIGYGVWGAFSNNYITCKVFFVLRWMLVGFEPVVANAYLYEEGYGGAYGGLH